MINGNYLSADRTNKLIPSSPQPRRKHPDFPSGPQQPLPNVIDQRKEPMSPQHFYPQKVQTGKPLDASTEKEYSLQGVVRELSDRVVRLTQKLGQHESILIKMTENSIETNKEEYKKGGKGEPRQWDLLSEGLAKIRRDFEDYRTGNIATREIEVKNQLFSELIHKSEERMRQEMQQLRTELQTRGEHSNAGFSDERMEEIDRLIRKLEKTVALNTTNIFAAHEKVESLSSSLDGHVDLVSAEFNKAYNKIVSFVNDKMSKSITDSIAKLTERIDRAEAKAASPSLATTRATRKSDKPAAVAEYRETLRAASHELVMSERVYHIDAEGYVLDEQFYYLLDRSDQRIKLDESQMRLLRASNLFS